ncbi:LysR substrate-binding domain-containing protein [Paucibacter soli]|uniref:LysR substrate-binding domain-containing protein n=1 Tax=Paucibacter soli TaxID=3133433 RepID=UPI0030B0A034
MSLSLTRLTQLDLLRGFVAVARRMSITLAAQDLCLTQSAVSRQIAALEANLGCTLFLRCYRSIKLSPEGERLFRRVDPAFQQLQDGLAELLAPAPRRSVTLTASIGVASLWLLPRLRGLQQQHPDIDLRVAASDRVMDLRADGIDLALRYCAIGQPPAGSVRLFGEAVLPVAHPALLAQGHALAELLPQQVLLEFDDARRPWLQWADTLAARGLSSQQPRAMLRFNQYDQVIQACLAGQGLALGRLALVAPMLADGRLRAIEPQAVAQPCEHAYWLLRRPGSSTPAVQAVVDWLLQEAASTQLDGPA